MITMTIPGSFITPGGETIPVEAMDHVRWMLLPIAPGSRFTNGGDYHAIVAYLSPQYICNHANGHRDYAGEREECDEVIREALRRNEAQT